MQLPNYMQMRGVARSLGADVRTFRLRQERGWEPDWDEFERAVSPGTRLLYLSNPNNPTGAVLSESAMARIVDRCEATGTWLLSDEVYLGAEIDRPRTKSFWGMSSRVIVTSGLSKAYGIPGVRIGWIVAPEKLTADCWTQHDYLTIGPNKMSDRIARVAVEAANRERCYARTREILAHNLPIAREWIDSFGGRVTWQPPQAGAIALDQVRLAASPASSSPSAFASGKTRSSFRDPTSDSRAICASGWAGMKHFLREGLQTDRYRAAGGAGWRG